jgi:hypothetical protein
VRVYLPATLPILEQWLAAGEAAPPDGGAVQTVYAVTPALREWYHDADLDELEYAAQVDASVGSLGRLAVQPHGVARRVVVAADVDDALVAPAGAAGRAVLQLAGPVPVARWASALIDGPDASEVVAAAVAALPAAIAGDQDAQFALDEAEAHELAWYAVQELPQLFS